MINPIRRGASPSALEDRLLQILDAVPTLVSYLGRDLRYVFANRAYEEWFGRPREEIVGRSVREVLLPEALKTILPHMERALRGERVTYEARLPYPGQDRWIQATYVPDRAPDGTVSGFFAFITDWTARRTSEERERFLAWATEILSGSLDYEAALGRVAALAVPEIADACAVFLAERDALRPLAVVHPGRDTARIAGRLLEIDSRGPRKVLRTGESDLEPEVEDEALRNLGLRSSMTLPLTVRGRTFGVLLLASAGSGRRFGAEDLGFGRELARRAATAVDHVLHFRAAEQDKERIRLAVRSADLGTWDHDFQSGETRVDARWHELLDVPEGAAVDYETFLAAVHPEDRARVDEVTRRAYDPGSGGELKVEYRTRRGLWISARGRVFFDEADRPARFLGTVMDITDRKRYEEELERRVRERTAQLQEALRELDAFASTIAHDLRAPVRAMSGLSQAILEDYAGRPLTGAGQDYVRRISAAADRMDALIRDLLTYSRLEREEVRLAPLPLGLAVRQAWESAAGEGPAELSVEEPLPSVLAYEVTLVQSLSNLFSNAVKFVAPGVTPRVRVRAERAEGLVRLWVEDNGIGIDPVHHARLFGAFQRLHTVDAYPGTGIGLAIVKKAVERMGGDVGFESEPGRGSRFWIRLPEAGSRNSKR